MLRQHFWRISEISTGSCYYHPSCLKSTFSLFWRGWFHFQFCSLLDFSLNLFDCVLVLLFVTFSLSFPPVFSYSSVLADEFILRWKWLKQGDDLAKAVTYFKILLLNPQHGPKTYATHVEKTSTTTPAQQQNKFYNYLRPSSNKTISSIIINCSVQKKELLWAHQYLAP